MFTYQTYYFIMVISDQVFNINNEMRVIHKNKGNSETPKPSMQSQYQELEDTSYQEILEPSTVLVSVNTDNTGKYVNVVK